MHGLKNSRNSAIDQVPKHGRSSAGPYKTLSIMPNAVVIGLKEDRRLPMTPVKEKSLPPLDREAIWKVIKTIQKNPPEQFAMGTFIKFAHFEQPIFDGQIIRHEGVCGTACCIAGWTALALADTHEAWQDADFKNDPSKIDKVKYSHLKYDVEIRAAQALGLTTEESYRLF